MSWGMMIVFSLLASGCAYVLYNTSTPPRTLSAAKSSPTPADHSQKNSVEVAEIQEVQEPVGPAQVIEEEPPTQMVEVVMPPAAQLAEEEKQQAAEVADEVDTLATEKGSLSTERESSESGMEMEELGEEPFSIRPQTAEFHGEKDQSTHRLRCHREGRFAYKLMVTDINHFRVAPHAFGFVTRQWPAKVVLVRYLAPPKDDKMKILLLKVDEDEPDAMKAFEREKRHDYQLILPITGYA